MTHSLPDPTERRCCKCPQTTDLTPLGDRNYCPTHFREKIADLEIEYEQTQDNSGAWER